MKALVSFLFIIIVISFCHISALAVNFGDINQRTKDDAWISRKQRVDKDTELRYREMERQNANDLRRLREGDRAKNKRECKEQQMQWGATPKEADEACR